MELTERKKKILRAIVEHYIKAAEPVGSKAIAAMPDMNFSSATIRNEMADLTAMGYLEQPHTSAGRIDWVKREERNSLSVLSKLLSMLGKIRLSFCLLLGICTRMSM